MDIQTVNIKVSFLDEVFNLEVVVDNRPERNNKIADSKMEIVLLKLVPDNKNLVLDKRKSTGMLYVFEAEFKALVRYYINGVNDGYDRNFVHKLESYITSAWKTDEMRCQICGGIVVKTNRFGWDNSGENWIQNGDEYLECTKCKLQTIPCTMNHTLETRTRGET